MRFHLIKIGRREAKGSQLASNTDHNTQNPSWYHCDCALRIRQALSTYRGGNTCFAHFGVCLRRGYHNCT